MSATKLKMKTKLIIIFILLNFFKFQEKKEVKLIKEFIVLINDKKINTKVIVDNYLQIKKDSTNTISIEDRKYAVENWINQIRYQETEANSLIPKYHLSQVRNFYIFPFSDFEKLSLFNFSGLNTLRNDAFVLLDDKKEKILQYFLLNKEHDKIISFNLLTKSDIAWFVEY